MFECGCKSNKKNAMNKQIDFYFVPLHPTSNLASEMSNNTTRRFVGNEAALLHQRSGGSSSTFCPIIVLSNKS